ncbi:unnamed protein product [Polarella glacialis]|uniref:Uncharacterized protein n=1 Tax=Polarella glacialis TaxID=89957 RepID=A0A813EIK6_POLGL|nr:unnamed protein product [Polarella glacialis]
MYTTKAPAKIKIVFGHLRSRVSQRGDPNNNNNSNKNNSNNNNTTTTNNNNNDDNNNNKARASEPQRKCADEFTKSSDWSLCAARTYEELKKCNSLTLRQPW